MPPVHREITGTIIACLYTVCNLFGMARCGGNVDGFLARRAELVFNLLRVHVPVSPLHPPDNSYSTWRGAFSALGIIHGFENSWGPFTLLSEDQPGMPRLLQLRRLCTEIVPFQRLRRAWELATDGSAEPVAPVPRAFMA